MKRCQLLSLVVATCLASAVAAHSPRSGFSFSIGVGAPMYRPWYPGPWYYRPYPIYYAPPPRIIVAEPAPVIVRPEPVYVPASSYVPAPSYSPASSPTVVATPSLIPASSPADVDRHLQMLSTPDESTRRDAVMELGRMKAERAVDALTASLAGDRSAVVRDAAARALGLIGSPRALTALIHAAQADADRDVRRSAQFAVEIIQSNLRR